MNFVPPIMPSISLIMCNNGLNNLRNPSGLGGELDRTKRSYVFGPEQVVNAICASSTSRPQLFVCYVESAGGGCGLRLDRSERMGSAGQFGSHRHIACQAISPRLVAISQTVTGGRIGKGYIYR